MMKEQVAKDKEEFDGWRYMKENDKQQRQMEVIFLNFALITVDTNEAEEEFPI